MKCFVWIVTTYIPYGSDCMVRKKNSPDRVIDDDEFLFDLPKPTLYDLPKGLDIVISPRNLKIETRVATGANVDVLTKRYLGDGKLPQWMKNTPAPRMTIGHVYGKRSVTNDPNMGKRHQEKR